MMKRLTRGLWTLLLALILWGALASPAAAWTYSIKWGDSLYKIARRNGTTVARLRAANSLRSNLIRAGSKLWIPAAGTSIASRKGIDSRAVQLLARLIHAEAAGEPFAGQVAVGAVVMNRLADGRFPGTIEGNIFRRHEFESVTNGRIWTEPSAENYQAARSAIAGWDPTGGARYFYNPAKTRSRWIWSRPVIARIGRHVFAR